MGQYNFQELLYEIKKWNMTKEESLAWVVAVTFLKIATKYFPRQRFSFPKKGDPRKKLLFRYCYKLVRETKDYLKPQEYKLYILAQVQTLLENVEDAWVQPNCLVGPKAWSRWLEWKKKIAKRPITSENTLDNDEILRIKEKMKKTVEFLRSKKVKSLKDAILAGKIKNWVALGVVDGYFLAMHPDSAGKDVGIDLGIFRDKIDDRLRTAFGEVNSL